MALIARLRLFAGETEIIGHAHEVDQRLRSHLSHDLATMNFDCHLAQFELSRDLFVQLPGHDERQDLSLARGQRVEAPLQFRDQRGPLAPGPILLDPGAGRFGQICARVEPCREGCGRQSGSCRGADGYYRVAMRSSAKPSMARLPHGMPAPQLSST